MYVLSSPNTTYLRQEDDTQIEHGREGGIHHQHPIQQSIILHKDEVYVQKKEHEDHTQCDDSGHHHHPCGSLTLLNVCPQLLDDPGVLVAEVEQHAQEKDLVDAHYH